MKNLLLALLIFLPATSFAGGDLKIAENCTDSASGLNVTIVRPGILDFLQITKAKITIRDIESGDILGEELLLKDEGELVVLYDQKIGSKKYSVVLESDSYLYYSGLVAGPADEIIDINKVAVVSKLNGRILNFTCDSH